MGTEAPLFLHIVAPFALAYLLSYLFRVVNAVAGPAIAGEFGIDASDLGFLTSVYFLSFAAVQLPLGVLLDRYGPKLVQGILLSVAAVGALVFAAADSVGMLAAGRAIIGVGVSASLMGAFKAYAMVVPPVRLPMVNGLHLAAGGLGALAGGTPTELFINAAGWRGLFVALAVICVVSALLIIAFAPRAEKVPQEESLARQMRSIWHVVSDPLIVTISLFCVPNHAAGLAIQTLWAGSWLRDVQGLSPTEAASVLSLMAAFMVAGFLGLGALTTQAARLGYNTVYVALSVMALFMGVQGLLVVAPSWAGIPVWCAFSALATSGILLFPAIASYFPRSLAGRVNTTLNFLVFVASFIIQWLIGVTLDWLSPGFGMGGAFNVAFVALLAVQAAGLAVVLWKLPPMLAARGKPQP